MILPLLAVTAAAACTNAVVARADRPEEQAAVITGKITDTGGKPIADAFVAAYDAKRNVVASAHTNEHGEYSLAVPRSALHVDRKGKTFFTQVKANFNRAVSVASTAIPVVHAVSDGSTAIRSGQSHSDYSQRSIVVDRSLAPAGSTKLPAASEAQKMPGAMMLKAVAPGCDDITAVTQAYWIQQEVDAQGSPQTVVGWMDGLVMARSSTNKSGSISSVPVKITDCRVSPSLVKHGDRVRITAELSLPQEPKIYPVVVARDSGTGQMWELMPLGKGRYAAEATIGEDFKPNDHTVSILAYAAEGSEGGRRMDLEDEINKAHLWDTRRPFVCNPLLIVSRNRTDSTLTVVPDAATAPAKQ